MSAKRKAVFLTVLFIAVLTLVREFHQDRVSVYIKEHDVYLEKITLNSGPGVLNIVRGLQEDSTSEGERKPIHDTGSHGDLVHVTQREAQLRGYVSFEPSETETEDEQDYTGPHSNIVGEDGIGTHSKDNIEATSWTVSPNDYSLPLDRENSELLAEDTDKEADNDLRDSTGTLGTSNHTLNYPLPLTVGTTTLSENACTRIGQSPRFTSSKEWYNFLTSLEKYATFHKEQLIQLKSGDRNVRTLTWSCYDSHSCSGIGDQMSRILQLLLYSMMSDRVFIIYWDEVSQQTMQYLQPNKIDWSYFNEELGMHKMVESEIRGLSFFKPHDYTKLHKLLKDQQRTHITLNHELLIPFSRGFQKAMSWCQHIKRDMHKIGVTNVLAKVNNIASVNLFLGELLRYLFHFSQDVVDAVDQIQKSLGIFDTPYLGVHMRTGFLGTEFEEKGRFNQKKVHRNSKDWESSLNCSVKLAIKYISPNAPVFLATDSYLVKELAAEKYGGKIRTTNVTLQHVAYVTGNHSRESGQPFLSNVTNGSSKETGFSISHVNGYMATWVDFLLLARSSVLVHSISGFSSVAGQFCSITSQYYTPWCTKTPK